MKNKDSNRLTTETTKRPILRSINTSKNSTVNTDRKGNTALKTIKISNTDRKGSSVGKSKNTLKSIPVVRKGN
jgi:hypothetical protein